STRRLNVLYRPGLGGCSCCEGEWGMASRPSGGRGAAEAGRTGEERALYRSAAGIIPASSLGSSIPAAHWSANPGSSAAWAKKACIRGDWWYQETISATTAAGCPWSLQ